MKVTLDLLHGIKFRNPTKYSKTVILDRKNRTSLKGLGVESTWNEPYILLDILNKFCNVTWAIYLYIKRYKKYEKKFFFSFESKICSGLIMRESR